MGFQSYVESTRRARLCAAIAAALASGAVLADEDATTAAADEAPPITTEASASAWAEGISLSGVVEVEASFWDQGGDEGSDITLSTVELGVDATINDWTAAHLTFLYEDGENDDNISVDEGYITIKNSDVSPAYLTAGRIYVPFGRFDSLMVSDPLTLEVGETQEDAVQVGWEPDGDGIYGSLWVFNGDTNDGGSDTIEHAGANIGFRMEQDGNTLDVGADWISSIGDTDGLALETVDGYTPGVAVHATAAIGDFEFMGEYLTATEDVDGPKTKVEALNLEAGYHFSLMEKDNTVALGYQRTYEAAWLDLPRVRTLGSWSVDVLDNTSVAFEYAHETNYGETNNNVGTIQLATEF